MLHIDIWNINKSKYVIYLQYNTLPREQNLTETTTRDYTTLRLQHANRGVLSLRALGDFTSAIKKDHLRALPCTVINLTVQAGTEQVQTLIMEQVQPHPSLSHGQRVTGY